MTESALSLPIAITLGDPAGIGPETIVKAFSEAPELTRGCFVVGDLAIMRRAARVVAGDGVALPVAELSEVQEALGCPPRCVPVWQISSLALDGAPPVQFGQISARAGQLAGLDATEWLGGCRSRQRAASRSTSARQWIAH